MISNRESDDGLWGQGLRRRVRTAGDGYRDGGGKKQRLGKKWVVQGEWEWDSTQEFIIERLLRRMVTETLTGNRKSPGGASSRRGQCSTECCGRGGQKSLLHGRMRRTSPEVRLTLWRSLTRRRRPQRLQAWLQERTRRGPRATRKARCEQNINSVEYECFCGLLSPLVPLFHP